MFHEDFRSEPCGAGYRPQVSLTRDSLSRTATEPGRRVDRMMARPLFAGLDQYSLRGVLLVFVIVPIAVLISAAGWLGLSNLERQIELRLQEEIELVARAIQLPLSDALERDRPGSLQYALDSAFQIDRVYGAYVYDDSGDLVAASGPFGSRVSSRSEARAVTESGSHGEYADRGGQEVFSYFVPLSDTAGRINGLLQVTRHGDDFHDYLRRMRTISLPALLTLLVILSVVVVYGHDRAIGRLLRGLESDMGRIRSGDRRYRVPQRGPREIRSLTGAMNTMLDAIDSSEQKLEAGRAEQRVLQQRLRQAEKMAAIGQLSAGVAHELGTPLNIVDGHAQRLARNLGPDSASTRSTEAIRTEVRRMEHIVRQLIDVGRRNPLNRRKCRADRLVRSALARLDGRAPKDLVDIQVAGDPMEPWVDQERLEQALVNLLTNAIQASPTGVVRIQWHQEGDDAVFIIDDDGPGVPEGQRQQMFEPFFTTKHVGEGIGLGLAVAHGAVADHEGSIEALDSPLGGMRFVIRLPMGSGEHG